MNLVIATGEAFPVDAIDRAMRPPRIILVDLLMAKG